LNLINYEGNSCIPKDDNRIIRAEGGSLLADDMAVAETHMMPDGTEMPGATHGRRMRTWLQTKKWKKNF
jgi:hypothetical protein